MYRNNTHLAFSRIKRDKILVGEIDTLTLERQRDRQLIVQLRETIVEAKLEIESLMTRKAVKTKTVNKPQFEPDLFRAPKPKQVIKPKRFVPNLLRKPKLPELKFQ